MITLRRALETLDLALLKQAVEKEGEDVNNFIIQDKTVVPLFCPLVHAVYFKWVEGVSYLIDAKANVNACHPNGQSILSVSVVQHDNAKITRLLLEKGAVDLNALLDASQDKTVDSLRELCRVTKNLEFRDAEGRTALFCAVKYYAQNAAAVLIDAGAKVSSVELAVLPKWFSNLVDQRKKLKQTLIVLFALARPLVGKDVAKILIAMAWETRDFSEWKK
jgi:ankyrin repeat protein